MTIFNLNISIVDMSRIHLFENRKCMATIDADILVGAPVLFNDWILILHPYVVSCAKSWSNHTAATVRKLRLLAVLRIG